MTTVQIITMCLSLGWFGLGLALPHFLHRFDLRILWGLIVSGVPVLGLLTLNWGPMAGAAGFALGLAVLLRPRGRVQRGDGVAPLE